MIGRIVLLVIAVGGICSGAVRFDGNHHYKDASLLDVYLHAKGAADFTDAIVSNYRSEGYLEATASTQVTASDTVISIHEGKCFSLSDLRVQGIDDTLTAILFSQQDQSQLLTNTFFDGLAVDILSLLVEHGYPFASLTVRQLAILDSSVVIEYLLVGGPRSPIGSISFPGLIATNPETLRRRLPLRSGSLFREGDLIRSQQNLSQLPYCRLTGAPQIIYDGGKSVVDISFSMKDENNVAFNGLIYLAQGNALAGQADVSLLNVLGGGEELRFLWTKQNAFSKKLSFDFRFPYLSGYPFDLRTALSQDDRDSSFVATSIAATVDYHLADQWSVGGVFRWDKITPEENRITPSARLLSIGLTNRYDHRDDIRRTTRGLFLEQSLVSAYRQSFAADGGISSGYSTRLEGEMKLWKPLGNDLVWYQRGYLFQIKSDFNPVPVEQLVQVGGAESVRGYRENSHLASSGIVTATELRWFALGNLMLRLFIDNGYIRATTGDRGLTGFGAGMVITTTAGAFRLDLSMGEEKEFGRMLVHLGFSGSL